MITPLAYVLGTLLVLALMAASTLILVMLEDPPWAS